jgi:hypothetical protein
VCFRRDGSSGTLGRQKHRKMQQPLMGQRLTSPQMSRAAAALAVGFVLVLCSVAVVDLQRQGAQTAELAEVLAVEGPSRLAGKRIIIAKGNMLMDAALEPLYTEHNIDPYEWAGNHADDYDPEAQNAWGDLPMDRDDIFDPDDLLRGDAPKDMSKSCDKDDSCEPAENVWEYLPEVEAKSMSTKGPHVPAYNAWSEMTLDY